MAEKLLIETESSGLYRDNTSMALINTDRASFAAYKMKRQKGSQVKELSIEVASLKQDMVDIKTMLTTLTEGLNGK